MIKLTAAFASIALLAGSPAFAQTAPAGVKVTADGFNDKDAGDWTVVTRDDGSKQWAYKGKPLYTFFRDTAGQPATGVSAAWPRAKQ